MIIFSALLLIVLSFQSCRDQCRPEGPLNVIVILADDHANKAISAYGNTLIETPNIDRLASEGVLFTNAFCSNAICSPSRASFLTGTLSHVHGVIDNEAIFDTSLITFPKLMQDVGYETALFGKWHLKSTPSGFDKWSILPGQGEYYDPEFISDSGRFIHHGYVTDIITDMAMDFLKAKHPGKPFCLLLHHKAPHRNWEPPVNGLEEFDGREFPVPADFHETGQGLSSAFREQEMTIASHLSMDYDLKMPSNWWDEKDDVLLFGDDRRSFLGKLSPEDSTLWDHHYRARYNAYQNLPGEKNARSEWKYREYLEDYLSTVRSVDENLGELMQYLEKEGLLSNTVVVYTSDQGFYLGEHGWYDKRFMYEESMRLPLIIRYPCDKAGKVDDRLLLNSDLAPTLLELAGIDIPGTMQGLSFAGAFDRTLTDAEQEAVYYHYFEYPGMHAVKRHYGLRTKTHKLIHYYYDVNEWELFNLVEDPLERINLYAEPSNDGLIKSLKEQLNGLQTLYGDTLYLSWLPPTQESVDHFAIGAKVDLKFPVAEKYGGEHPELLVDGLAYPEGPADRIPYKGWAGIQGKNLIFTIDLGQVKPVSEVQINCLQDQKSWIFLPAFITLSVADERQKFTETVHKLIRSSQQEDQVLVRRYSMKMDTNPVRYVRLTLSNMGELPDWFGTKGEAWLFADEVMVW